MSEEKTPGLFAEDTDTSPQDQGGAEETPRQGETTEEYFNRLVGEGKKYKTPEDLAKSRIEADRFIEQLKSELAEVRGELKSRLSLEEMFDQLSQKKDENRVPEPSHQDTPSNVEENTERLTREEVLRLLQEEKKKEERESNIATVRRELKERFGSDYNQRLKQIAKDLAVSEKFLSDMAETSPSGFLRLVDSLPSESGKDYTPPKSDVDTGKAYNQSARKNKAYYDKLRSENLTLYLSPKVQNEMHKEAVRQGPDFFK